jgi:hypothetical protein
VMLNITKGRLKTRFKTNLTIGFLVSTGTCVK